MNTEPHLPAASHQTHPRAGAHGAVEAHAHGAADAYNHGAAEDAGLADVLDLDLDALADHWAAVLDAVREAIPVPPERILDLGAGTGAGSVALARTFPAAAVVAVDSSESMLQRVETKAAALQLSGRVRTVRADLDAAWPVAEPVDEPVDLIWASLSMHHLADPGRVLRDALAGLNDGGVIAIVEIDRQLRFLPAELGIGRPGLEDRLHDLLGGELARSVPELGSQWAPKLAAAGFADVVEHPFTIDLAAHASPMARRYAQLWLGRLRGGLADQLAPEDAAVLDAIVADDGPDSVLHREDLRVRGSRTLTLARRLPS